MKRKFIAFGVLTVSSLYIFGQPRPDSGYTRKKVPQTDIRLVYSHYIQDGNHSAITGGIGTERLIVYSPEITFKRKLDSTHGYSIGAGVDIISSASIDNIDFVVSSASSVSKHAYINASYNTGIKNKGVSLEPTAYFSIESAYISEGLGFSARHINKEKTRELSAGIEAFFDDLRWGRLNGERPLRLVYPVELRYKEWYDRYRRQSYNLSFELDQTLNKKMAIAIFPGISYQHGLLATPYHRVYFKDSSLRVENLPVDRIKIPIGIQLNSFIDGRYALRTYYRFYWDNFGILAHEIDLELAIKISPAFSLSPFFRVYTQTASSYFKPYLEHSTLENYYSSDYDLSSFRSYEGGLETRLAKLGKIEGRSVLKKFSLRYSYYGRTDGLHAHIISLMTDISRVKK